MQHHSSLHCTLDAVPCSVAPGKHLYAGALPQEPEVLLCTATAAEQGTSTPRHMNHHIDMYAPPSDACALLGATSTHVSVDSTVLQSHNPPKLLPFGRYKDTATPLLGRLSFSPPPSRMYTASLDAHACTHSPCLPACLHMPIPRGLLTTHHYLRNAPPLTPLHTSPPRSASRPHHSSLTPPATSTAYHPQPGRR